MARLTWGVSEYVIEPCRRDGTDASGEMDLRSLLFGALRAGRWVELARLVFPQGAPPWLRSDQLVVALVHAVERGALRVSRVPVPRRVLAASSANPASERGGGATTPEPAARETWFELRLVDELGEPIEGVSLRMQPGGVVPTDGAGAGRVTVPEAPQGGGAVAAIAELRGVVAPRWDLVRPGPWLEDAPRQSFVPLVGEPQTSVALSPERSHTHVIQPWVVRAHLDGLVFDTNKCFLLPDAVHRAQGDAPMDRLRTWLDAHPDTTALVVGHTDPSGDPSYNDPLSVERAETFIAFLTRDVAHWTAFYDHPAYEKRWGVHEDRAMLQALAERWGFPEFGRTQAFQAWAGVTVDGVIGPQTRGALVQSYMDLQDTSTALPASLLAHGCGESFPKMEKPDRPGVEGLVGDPDAQDQRRVEVFLFSAETGPQPPPTGQVSPQGSLEYPEWVRRARRTRDLRAKVGLARLTARVIRGTHAIPVELARVTLTGPDEETATFEQLSGGDGRAQFEGLEPGHYRVRAEKEGYEGSARTVQVRLTGVTDEDDVALSVFGDGVAGEEAPSTDPLAPDEVPLPMKSSLKITVLEGKTKGWPPQDASSPGRKLWDDTGFVYFEHAQDIRVEWAVQAPDHPIEVKLRRGGSRSETIWRSHTTDRHGPADPANQSQTGPTWSNGTWRGAVTLSQRARKADGTPNELFAPPEDDGFFRLTAIDTLDPTTLDAAAIPVAGVAFFGAVPGASLSTASVHRNQRRPATMTGAPVLHGEHGDALAPPFRSLLRDPHGYSAPGAEVRVEWDVVGSDHVDTQLEIFGAAPVAVPLPTAATAVSWPLERMSALEASLPAAGSKVVKNDLVTLRTTLHVFRKGPHSGALSETHWGSPERLGGSVLLVGEDRPLIERKFDTSRESGTARLAPIHPHPEGRGFYRSIRTDPVVEPALGDHQHGHEVVLEIIERAGFIWAKSHPDRPFGLGDIWGPFPAHKTHYKGLAWDVMALRTDNLREYSTGGQATEVTVFNPEDLSIEMHPRTQGRPTDTAPRVEPFDLVGMQQLILLFVDLLVTLSKDLKDESFQQVVFDDPRIVHAIKAVHPAIHVGTEAEVMQTSQQTHLWHTHFFVRLPRV